MLKYNESQPTYAYRRYAYKKECICHQYIYNFIREGGKLIFDILETSDIFRDHRGQSYL